MNFMPPMPFLAANSVPMPQTTDTEDKDEVEKKIEELIIMGGGKGPRRWRQRKKEYIKKLEQDNVLLKNWIVDLQQLISAGQAQKDIYRDQLNYFQGCLAQAALFVFQPQQKQTSPLSLNANNQSNPNNNIQINGQSNAVNLRQ